MKKLPVVFSKGDYQYSMVVRGQSCAIYKQRLKNGRGKDHFELVKPWIRPATTIEGKSYPESEAMPSNEKWGSMAFTLPTLKKAKDKAKEMGWD